MASEFCGDGISPKVLLGRDLTVLTGDYYGQPDDITRGLTLPTFTDLKGSGKPLLSMPLSLQCAESENAHKFFPEATLDLKDGFPSHIERFQCTDTPPALSPEISKELTPGATLVLKGLKPITAGNMLLGLLESMQAALPLNGSDFSPRQKMQAAIYKVNRKKFTIKAGIHMILEHYQDEEIEEFTPTLTCVAKMRIYHHEERDVCIVEFQRRSGDAVAFVQFLSQAQETLGGVAWNREC
jgi:hypothetical protein